jgi:N-acetylglucosaminyldiphosphoundecaprenol N-acetyl-beta-D-mannosaminyltransferase
MEIPPSVDVQGVSIAALRLSAAVDRVIENAQQKRGAYFTFTSAHGIVAAKSDPELHKALGGASANFADGTPVVWSARRKMRADQKSQAGRVFGPEFMAAMFFRAPEHHLSSFLCGGGEGLAGQLADRLTEKYSSADIVGTHTPPFRDITEDELRDLASTIAQSEARLIWIGLSTPKQEKFAARLAPLLPGRQLFTVGAAFDILAGLAKAAPPAIQDLGFEWAWRLAHEPRRLLPRYARIVPRFLWGEFLDRPQAGHKPSDLAD